MKTARDEQEFIKELKKAQNRRKPCKFAFCYRQPIPYQQSLHQPAGRKRKPSKSLEKLDLLDSLAAYEVETS